MTIGTAPAASKRRHAGLLVALGALSAFGPLSMDLYLPALPELGRDLGVGDAIAQLTMSLCMVGLALGQLVAGPLTDRRGRRPALIMGVAVYTVTSLLCALAPDIWLLVLLRFAQGLAGGAGMVISRAMVRDLFDGQRAVQVFSTLMMVSGLAPVLAPLLGGQLARVASWRGMFVVLAIIGLLLLLAAFALPETLSPEDRHMGGLRDTAVQFTLLGRDRQFVGYTLVLALMSCALFIYISLSSFVLQDGYGMSAQLFSVIFAVNSLGIVLAGRLNSLGTRRLSARALLGIGIGVGLTGGLISLAAAVIGWGAPGLLPGLFLVVSSLGVIMPNATALALEPHGRRAGSASAFLGTAQFLIGAAVPPLISGDGATAVTLTLGVLVAGLLALITYATTRRPKRA
ncbi:multidrug effflux MFS transporter [Nonomuraea jabiensis]|uniref:multidrug effflux MFS transporter n=1 Tax=Nonomuraea jabiensis TaxID=882448 RepID=UPI0034265565